MKLNSASFTASASALIVLTVKVAMQDLLPSSFFVHLALIQSTGVILASEDIRGRIFFSCLVIKSDVILDYLRLIGGIEFEVDASSDLGGQKLATIVASEAIRGLIFA